MSQILEYVDGGDLFMFMAQNKNLAERYICRIIHQLLKTMAYVHEIGITHTDIRLENVLIQKSKDMDKTIKIISWSRSQYFTKGKMNK